MKYMTFDLYPDTKKEKPEFKKYQEIEVFDKSPLYDGDGIVIRLTSGKYYVQNPVVNSMNRIRVCVSPKHCDSINSIIGWINVNDIKK